MVDKELSYMFCYCYTTLVQFSVKKGKNNLVGLASITMTKSFNNLLMTDTYMVLNPPTCWCILPTHCGVTVHVILPLMSPQWRYICIANKINVKDDIILGGKLGMCCAL